MSKKDPNKYVKIMAEYGEYPFWDKRRPLTVKQIDELELSPGLVKSLVDWSEFYDRFAEYHLDPDALPCGQMRFPEDAFDEIGGFLASRVALELGDGWTVVHHDEGFGADNVVTAGGYV